MFIAFKLPTLLMFMDNTHLALMTQAHSGHGSLGKHLQGKCNSLSLIFNHTYKGVTKVQMHRFK